MYAGGVQLLSQTFVLIVIVGLLLIGGLVRGAQPDCASDSGTIQRETYTSFRLGQEMFYTIYLPPCYETQTRTYPTLYLMHGSNEDDGQWGRLGITAWLDDAISSGRVDPFMVAMPFGNVIANRNRFDDLSWGQIFLTEFMPDVESRFRVDDRRAIGGISRGGFWAYHIGLQHPELFSAIGGHSAFFDRFHAPPEANPLDLALNAPGVESLRLWLDRGADDFAAEGLDIMHDRLNQRGLEHIYRIAPTGEHNNLYWSQHLAEYLDFYIAGWLSDPVPTVVPLAPPSAFATNTPQGVSTVVPMVTPTATMSDTATAGQTLLLPVAAFASLRTSISAEALAAIRRGELEPDLLLETDTAAYLRIQGVNLHPDIRLVAPERLRDELWRDRRSYTLLPIESLALDLRPLWVDDRPVVDQLDDYPFLFSGGSFDVSRLRRLTLSGVTALTRNTLRALDDNGVEWAAGGIAEYVQASDWFHISNEVSIVSTCPQTSGPTLGGSSSFCSKPEHFELLKLLDVDIVELSGNHNNDYGYDAYADTLAFYRSAGMQVVGGAENPAEAQAPLLMDAGGTRIGWLSCNAVGPYYALANEDPALLGGIRPGAAACADDWLAPSLAELRQQVDIVLLSVQHVEFEEYVPSNAQRFDYRKWIDMGADAVFGTAPHKPQTFEFYRARDGRQGFIHYGLGNLYFDQPFWGNMRFFLDTLYLYDGRLLGIELFPGLIEDAGRPRLMTPDERENFLFFMFVQQNGW